MAVLPNRDGVATEALTLVETLLAERPDCILLGKALVQCLPLVHRRPARLVGKTVLLLDRGLGRRASHYDRCAQEEVGEGDEKRVKNTC